MHSLYPIQYSVKKMTFLWCGCYEGELIHRFGSNSPDWKRGTDTFLPRNSLSAALNHSEDHVPRIDSRMLHSPDVRECVRERERERERGEGRPVVVRKLHTGEQKKGFLPFALSKASEQRSDRAPRPRGRTTKWYPTEILCVHNVFADYVTPRRARLIHRGTAWEEAGSAWCSAIVALLLNNMQDVVYYI